MQPMGGYSVTDLDEAIGKLEDPARLERARARFTRSPKSVHSDSDETEFEYVEPHLPDPMEERLQYLIGSYTSYETRPAQQFRSHILYEIYRQFPNRSMSNFCDAAKVRDQVQAEWEEQGIWRSNWPAGLLKPVYSSQYLFGVRWKHEDALENEGETVPGAPTPPPHEPRDEEERRRMERERDASRPLPQFQYQVRKATDRLTAKHQEENDSGNTRVPYDIATMAYQEVKEQWTKMGLWNSAWGILPGRTWKHEDPLEDIVAIELPEAVPLYARVRREMEGDYILNNLSNTSQERKLPSLSPSPSRPPLPVLFPSPQSASCSSSASDAGGHHSPVHQTSPRDPSSLLPGNVSSFRSNSDTSQPLIHQPTPQMSAPTSNLYPQKASSPTPRRSTRLAAQLESPRNPARAPSNKPRGVSNRKRQPATPTPRQAGRAAASPGPQGVSNGKSGRARGRPKRTR